MTPANATKLGLKPRSTNVSAQKIDSSALTTHGIGLASFLLQNSQRRVQFSEKTFLLADTSMKILLKMPFLALSYADVEFTELRKLA